MNTMFGWEGGGLQRARAGSGWMVGSGVSRVGESLLVTGVIVWPKDTMESGILLIVLVPGLSSVPALQTGDQEIKQWFRRICSEAELSISGGTTTLIAKTMKRQD